MTGVLLLCVIRSHSRWGELYESCLSWALECLRTVVCEVDSEAHNHMSWEEKFVFLGCRSHRLREHFNLGIQIGGLWSWVCSGCLLKQLEIAVSASLCLKFPGLLLSAAAVFLLSPGKAGIAPLWLPPFASSTPYLCGTKNPSWQRNHHLGDFYRVYCCNTRVQYWKVSFNGLESSSAFWICSQEWTNAWMCHSNESL